MIQGRRTLREVLEAEGKPTGKAALSAHSEKRRESKLFLDGLLRSESVPVDRGYGAREVQTWGGNSANAVGLKN